jgi:aspartokinase
MSIDRIVIKCGGGVLSSFANCQVVADGVHSIYHEYRPSQLFVIFSAMKGQTDEAIMQVCPPDGIEELRNALSGKGKSRHDNPEVASYLLQPEITATHLMNEYVGGWVLDQDSPEFPIIANGSFINAEVQKYHTLSNSGKMMRKHGLYCVSGFGARNLAGQRVLLGRNASDLVAAWIAKLINADMLIYLKDVDGVYPDPSCQGEPVQKVTRHAKLDCSQVLDNRVYEVLENCGMHVMLGNYTMIQELAEMKCGTEIDYRR